jgi:hypothetical protein
MKILRLLLWLLVLSMAIPSTIPSNYCLNSLMLGLSYCCDLGANPNYSVVSTNGTLSVTPKVTVQ